MDILTVIVQKEDRGRNGWTTSVTIVRSLTLQSMWLHNLRPTGQDQDGWTYEMSARTDIVIVVTVTIISQVGLSQERVNRFTSTFYSELS